MNNLRTEYRSPLGVGTGLTYFVGKSKIHLSSEWFNRIPEYTVMGAINFIGQSKGDTNAFKLLDEAKYVINAGLGIELFLSEKINFYISTSTDFSAVVADNVSFSEGKSEANISVFKSNFYHFGGGFVLDIKGADITLGVTHTGAKINLPRPFSFPEDGDDNIFDPNDLIEVDWDRWRIVFSFSLPFLKDV